MTLQVSAGIDFLYDFSTHPALSSCFSKNDTSVTSHIAATFRSTSWTEVRFRVCEKASQSQTTNHRGPESYWNKTGGGLSQKQTNGVYHERGSYVQRSLNQSKESAGIRLHPSGGYKPKGGPGRSQHHYQSYSRVKAPTALERAASQGGHSPKA